jgi:hypothetical protein
MSTTEAIRDLASLTAEVIRRMGATYGDAATWRADITRAVKIMEHFHALTASKEGEE